MVNTVCLYNLQMEQTKYLQISIDILQNDAKYIQKNNYKKYDEFAGRDEKMATPSQLRKLEVVWACISKAEDK